MSGANHKLCDKVKIVSECDVTGVLLAGIVWPITDELKNCKFMDFTKPVKQVW